MFGKGITIFLRKPQPGRRDQRKEGHSGERRKPQVGTGHPTGRWQPCVSWPVKNRWNSGTGAKRGATDEQQPRVTELASRGQHVLRLAGSPGPSCKGRDWVWEGFGFGKNLAAGPSCVALGGRGRCLVRLGAALHGGRGLACTTPSRVTWLG